LDCTILTLDAVANLGLQVTLLKGLYVQLQSAMREMGDELMVSHGDTGGKVRGEGVCVCVCVCVCLHPG
jgi:hypothetical protein